MRAPDVNIGPLRSTHGLVDVSFDGADLRLRPVGNPLEVLHRYRLVVLGWCLLLLIAGGYADGSAAVVLFAASGGCFAVLVVLVVTEAVAIVAAVGVGLSSMVTKEGRRRLLEGARTRPQPGAVVVPEPDIRQMDPVHGRWRAHLVLDTVHGELRLSGWGWRRHQLVKLQRALAA